MPCAGGGTHVYIHVVRIFFGLCVKKEEEEKVISIGKGWSVLVIRFGEW